MMMIASKFHKNGVLTGCVDCYCLACDSHLRCEEDASSHIEKPMHKKNLESTHYLDKYKEDHVRKVKKGYYCEFCNVLLQTTAKVSLHTAEPKHHDNKGIQLLKRLGNSVISPDDVFINENAWNGFIDETCAICNTEFYCEHIHKTEQKHILNLIQRKVIFGEDKTVYRKIDETSFQCLTCNMIFALSTITTHSTNEDNKTLYAKCREFQPPVATLFNENETKENDVPKNHKSESENTVPNVTKNCDNPKIETPNTDHKKEVIYGMVTKISDENLVNVTDNKRKPEKDKSATENLTKKQKSGPENEQEKILTRKLDFIACINEQKDKNDDSKTPDSKTHTEKKQQNDKSADENATESGLNKEGNDNSDASATEVDRQINLVKKEVKKRVIVKKKKCVASTAEDFVENAIKVAKNLPTQCDKKSEENVTKNTDSITKDIIDDNTQIAAGVDQVCIPAEPVLRLNAPQKETPIIQGNINLITKQKESNNQNNENIFENLSDYQKNGININFETVKAICMKCFESIGLDCKAIEDHINEHKDKPNSHAVLFKPVLNKNHCKTVLKEEKKASKNVDHNQNITNDCQTPDDSKALVRYVPIAPYYVPTDVVNVPEVPKEETPQETPKEDPKDPESYAKANKLTFNKGNKNAFCRLCSTRLPSSLRSMKEHVNGNAHKTKATRVANLKPIIPKKPMKVFIKECFEIENRYLHDIVVNNRLCITSLSYWMITENEVTFRCQACEVNLSENDITNHVKGYFHEKAMKTTPVVWNLDTEFVREVRPGIFHCGFCNLVLGCWENVAPHLKCEDHEDYQFDASCRLDEHMPDLLEHRRQRERQFMRLLVNHIF